MLTLKTPCTIIVQSGVRNHINYLNKENLLYRLLTRYKFVNWVTKKVGKEQPDITEIAVTGNS